MTRICTILALTLAGGCAATEPQAVDRPMTTASTAYAAATASALAFDPPAVIGQPMPNFSRDGRSLAAFAGYEQQVTTFSYTHQRDEIRVQNDFGTLERRAYTDRTSVTTR